MSTSALPTARVESCCVGLADHVIGARRKFSGKPAHIIWARVPRDEHAVRFKLITPLSQVFATQRAVAALAIERAKIGVRVLDTDSGLKLLACDGPRFVQVPAVLLQASTGDL